MSAKVLVFTAETKLDQLLAPSGSYSHNSNMAEIGRNQTLIVPGG